MATLSSSPLRLALVGMSGAGKTFWTKRLAESGHPNFCCDDAIEQRLRSRLAAGGHAGINGVAAWMGWPDSPTYAEREAEYLAQEIAVLDEVLGQLERNPKQSLILDTTGSIIYTGTNLLWRLRKQMTVVYLAASHEEQQLLIERYLTNPKPVLWRGAFQRRPGEKPQETVARCYPTLIAARRRSYEALAHCSLPVADLRALASSSDAGVFLAKVHAALELAESK
jgi:shikimate kinase